VCVSVYVSVCVCLSLSLSLCVCMCLCVSLSGSVVFQESCSSPSLSLPVRVNEAGTNGLKSNNRTYGSSCIPSARGGQVRERQCDPHVPLHPARQENTFPAKSIQ